MGERKCCVCAIAVEYDKEKIMNSGTRYYLKVARLLNYLYTKT